MIRSNLIKNDDKKSYGLDFGLEGEYHKIICEYLFILFSLYSNDVIDNDMIEMFNEIVKLAIKDGNDFNEFANGVLSTYLKSKKG